MRFKTKWEKFVITTIGISIGFFLVGTGNVKAVLQANPATHSAGKLATGASWITSIREMETSGQTMGLNETLSETGDLTPTSSNNIDVHMMKATEYGAMAILSASGFGYSGKLQDAPVKSTTGNVTGVYVTGTRWEWTAGVCSDAIVGKAARYYDLYTSYDQTSARVGDALGLDTYTTNPGCSGWHDSVHAAWLIDAYNGFVRGYDGIFSFSSRVDNFSVQWNVYGYCGRGVAVVGANL